MRHKIYPVVVLFLVLIFGALGIFAVWKYFSQRAHADNLPQSWLIWRDDDAAIYPTKLWKIQDGNCSIYIATTRTDHVAISLVQGCK